MNFDWTKYFNDETFEKALRIGIILVVGIVIITLLGLILKKLLPPKLSQQRKMLINRFVRYSAIIILFSVIVSELNINLAAIFGAAGVIGIVVGVASQTSIGNIVSGFFMVSEKSFEIGDQIRIGDKTGVVHSIDLLSIKIKTFDNLLLRIPNQTVISSEVINVTRFPVRRLDFDLSVAYKENLEVVKQTLEEIAKRNPLCLDEPEPIIVFKSFGQSGINILFGVWFERTNYLKVKNSVFMEIKEAFEQKGIEIPFPHVSIYTGDITKPFPVEIKEKA
ncbi:MAG TPA: mechanosensitive ion channel family protein [Prolixibacteraceae bacterium]|nr:mechanosensitive ion channel family protein [Prolixibacteraceae bacterium]